MIKKKGISKERAKQIKQERRTLKNRGYAANCRVKRENEEKLLEEKNKQLRRDIYWQQVRLEDSKNELKELTNKLNQLTDTCVHMKREEEEFDRMKTEKEERERSSNSKPDIKIEKMDDSDTCIKHETPFSIRRPFWNNIMRMYNDGKL